MGLIRACVRLAVVGVVVVVYALAAGCVLGWLMVTTGLID